MVAIIPAVDLPGDPWPKVQRYGLFTATAGPNILTPDHARGGGIRYNDVTSVLPAGFEVTCAEEVVTFADDCGNWVTGTPFAIQATMGHGSVGLSQSEIESTLLARLMAGEQSIAELIFSDGTFGQANSLANNATAPTPLPAAASVKAAVGELDSWLASVTSVRGIIHAPAIISSYLINDAGVVREGGRWVTPLGNIVSIGNYSGNSPAGEAPAAGHTYIYACESTVVFRTPDNQVFVSPFEANLDLARFVDKPPVAAMQNQIRAVARREYVVTHNNVFSSVDVTIA
jgi:hypothetical protein